MKNTCKQRQSTLGFGIFALAAILTSQISAQTLDSGTAITNSSDTSYNSTLFIGLQNPNNSLTIIDSSIVSAPDIVIGQYNDSTNNSVSITTGSFLLAGDSTTNGLSAGALVVGDETGNASVSLNNSSQIKTDYLYLGVEAGDSGKIEISNEGSEIEVLNDAHVGYAGSDSSIEIGSGAALNIEGILNVGSTGESDNQVNVSGLLFINSTNNLNIVDSNAGNGINVKANGTLQVGGAVDLEILEDSGVDLANNSTLEVGGTLNLNNDRIDGGNSIVLNNDLSAVNTAIWNSSIISTIGNTTANNALIFTNGAAGTSAQLLQVGAGSAARNNALLIGGSGSRLATLKNLIIGGQGDNNTLGVYDEGEVNVVGDLYLGLDAGATGNEINVGNAGTLNAFKDVIVGKSGNNNTFSINQGTVSIGNDFVLGSASKGNRYNQVGGTNIVTGDFVIGKTENASGGTGGPNTTSGNLGTIGDVSTLNVLQNLMVGQEGDGSVLLIKSGGLVTVSGDAIIGEKSDDNYIFLDEGSNSQFNVKGDLTVGLDGGLNRFAVYGGTATIDGSIFIGASTNEHTQENYIHVDTTNGILNVANTIHVGASNSLNELTIAQGGTVNTKELRVGAVVGVSNNTVTVSGRRELVGGGWAEYVTNSILTVSDALIIGSSSNSANNSVTVQDGGILNVEQDNITIAGTNNILNIADGGILKTLGWDFGAMTNSATNIVFSSGSTLHLSGILEGTNMVEGGLSVILDGASSSWNTDTNSLFVGYESDNNSLTITNGASASTLTNLYIGYASKNNLITVEGTGTELNVGNDLFIGNADIDKSGLNSLFVLSGGLVNVGNDLENVHGGILKIDSASRVEVGGDYEQDRFSTLEVGISTNQTSPNLKVAGTAELASGSTIKVYNDGIGENDTNFVQNILVSEKLTIDDKTASTGLLIDNINIETNMLLGFTTTVSNSNTIVLDNFIVRSIGEAADLEGQLLDVADEINGLVAQGDSNAVAMARIIGDMSSSKEVNKAMDNYYGEKSSSTPANNMVNLGIQSVAQQITMRADNTRSRMGVASSAINWNKPAGVAGPHETEQDLQGWVSAYATKADQSGSGGFNSYDANISGFMIGVDLSVAENVLVGIAGGAGSTSIDKNNDADADTKTSFVAVYASTGTKDWFTDSSIIFGNSSIDSTLGSAFDTEADYDAKNIAFYFGGGKEITGKYLIFTPQASILGNYYKQDSYTEDATTAVAREVDSFDAFYLQSSLGASLGFYTQMGEVTLKPEIRLHWLHEWNADDESLDYSLVGGANNYSMKLQAPEEDILKLGIGTSAKLGDYLELRADLDTRQGSDYSDYTILGSLRYQF